MQSDSNHNFQPVSPQSQPPALMSNKKAAFIVGGSTLVFLLLMAGIYWLSPVDENRALSDPYAFNDSDEDELLDGDHSYSEEEIGKTINTDLGLSIAVDSMIRDFQIIYPQEGMEIILIKITASISENYNLLLSDSDFTVIADGGELGTTWRVVPRDLRDARIPPFGYSRIINEDQPASGYLAFEIPSETTDLIFRYLRPETIVVFGDEALPTKEHDVIIFSN